MRSDVPNLRTRPLGRLLFAAFGAARDRFGMRLTHFSIQSNHVHLIVEAADARALSRAVQGLSIRIAKRVNSRLDRRGPVLSDRYFARSLRTPLEVRRCVVYVMNNYRRHFGRGSARPPRDWADPFSSVDYFDGFRALASGRRPCAEFSLARDPPVVSPATWLLKKGWRRFGLIGLPTIPGGDVRPGSRR